MKLNEIIENSREKNCKFDNVNLSDFSDKQFFGALNLKASKEGTGYAGAFANWLFEMARTFNLDLVEARILGNILQQDALDSKHDGVGTIVDTLWYQISKLKNFKGNEIKIRQQIQLILDNVKVSKSLDECEELF